MIQHSGVFNLLSKSVMVAKVPLFPSCSVMAAHYKTTPPVCAQRGTHRVRGRSYGFGVTPRNRSHFAHSLTRGFTQTLLERDPSEARAQDLVFFI